LPRSQTYFRGLLVEPAPRQIQPRRIGRRVIENSVNLVLVNPPSWAPQIALKRILDRLWGYRTSRAFAHLRDGALVVHHDSGFFSNCSTILLEIARSKEVVDTIDTRASFTHFSEGTSGNPWGEFFLDPIVPGGRDIIRWNRSRISRRLPHHSFYSLIDFRLAHEIIGRYFFPSQTIMDTVENLQGQYALDLAKTAVLCVRGTDKATEVKPTSLARYIRKARRLLRRHSSLMVWVQTDQRQIRDQILSELGPRAFAIKALPVTEGTAVIHRSAEIANRAEFTRNLIAVVWLMSQAKFVITYTGNVGYWIALFRGSTRRLTQFR